MPGTVALCAAALGAVALGAVALDGAVTLDNAMLDVAVLCAGEDVMAPSQASRRSPPHPFWQMWTVLRQKTSPGKVCG